MLHGAGHLAIDEGDGAVYDFYRADGLGVECNVLRQGHRQFRVDQGCGAGGGEGGERLLAGRQLGLADIEELGGLKAAVVAVDVPDLVCGAIRFTTLNKLCKVLECLPGDILERIKLLLALALLLGWRDGTQYDVQAGSWPELIIFVYLVD